MLVKSKRESPNIALKTKYPLRKYLKINYHKRYKYFCWVNIWQIINTLRWCL